MTAKVDRGQNSSSGSVFTSRSVSFYPNWMLLILQVGCRIQHLSQRLRNPFFLLSKNRPDAIDRLMIRVVTGNSTSRDLTNYDLGIESRVQDFMLDFWISSWKLLTSCVLWRSVSIHQSVTTNPLNLSHTKLPASVPTYQDNSFVSAVQ